VNDADWSKIEFFKPSEFVRDPTRVHFDLVDMLDEMRRTAGVPIKIHEAWAPDGHAKNSAHYAGLAVDFHFVGWPLLDQWLFAERFPWQGIGIYPYWNNPGLHVDLRLAGHEHIRLGRRWYRDRNNKYRALNRGLFNLLLSGSAPRNLS